MRPVQVEQLIVELREEKPRSEALVAENSKMEISTEAPRQTYSFDARESQLLLSSPEAIDRLFEALDYPEDASICLHGISIDDEIMEHLESKADAVDEL